MRGLDHQFSEEKEVRWDGKFVNIVTEFEAFMGYEKGRSRMEMFMRSCGFAPFYPHHKLLMNTFIDVVI